MGNRDRIYEILAGDVEYDSPVIDRSALEKIASQAMPTVHPSKTETFGPLVILFAGLAYVVKGPLTGDIESLLPFVIVITMLLWAYRCVKMRRHVVERLEGTVEKCIEELQSQDQYLRRYMQGLDQRTSKYFHCVTNTKVTTYFVLMQISTGIERRLSEVQALLARRTTDSFFAAYSKLQGSLVFTDGVDPRSGQTHMLPLARLSKTVPLLIENLEGGLKELEEEISVAKSQYTDQPES
ncbi:MAG: hypothetical protein K1X83_06375 [Oligoflexia bacterium]|nr:hypothetical protein [Oligoflexia bacterium]